MMAWIWEIVGIIGAVLGIISGGISWINSFNHSVTNLVLSVIVHGIIWTFIIAIPVWILSKVGIILAIIAGVLLVGGFVGSLLSKKEGNQ